MTLAKDVNGKLQESPIHAAFGLTYASWFIAPRLILQSMPYEWQQRFVNLMDELDEAFDWEPELEEGSYQVSYRDGNGKFAKIPHDLNNYRHGYCEHLRKPGYIEKRNNKKRLAIMNISPDLRRFLTK